MLTLKPAFAGKDTDQIVPAFFCAERGLLISISDFL
jgi:hypothetical protein